MSKKGFVCGVFDLFHAGHVLMLQDCKKHCDHLTVALNTANHIDPDINPDKKPPIFTIEERALIMASCRYVDEVLIYGSEVELEKIMGAGKFDVRFLGDDYKGKPITGPNLIPLIQYLNRDHGISSSEIKSRIKNEF